MTLPEYILFLILTWLVASIPFGLIYAAARGVNIRTIGSGNIGGTNAGRAFGFLGGFVPVTAFDILKSFVPLYVFLYYGVDFMSMDLATLILGSVAVLSHIYPIYVKGKGGKGIATGVGMLLAITPLGFIGAFLVFLLVLLITRTVGIASVIASISLPLWVLVLEPFRFHVILFTGALTCLIIYTHRNNLRQIFTKDTNSTQ